MIRGVCKSAAKSPIRVFWDEKSVTSRLSQAAFRGTASDYKNGTAARSLPYGGGKAQRLHFRINTGAASDI